MGTARVFDFAFTSSDDFCARLELASANLRRLFDSLPEAERGPYCGALSSADGATDFAKWLGIGAIGNTHKDAQAIDLDYTWNPYVATREQDGKLGGESGPSALSTQARARALEACDRAIKFWSRDPAGDAKLFDRRPGEDTGSVWDRFREASEALRGYLGLVFKPNPANMIKRPWLENAETASLDELEAAMAGETFGRAASLDVLQEVLGGDPGVGTLLGLPDGAAEAVYLQVLRDHEMVRRPMVYGDPSERPGKTRAPINGFLRFRREVAVELCDRAEVELWWGACDFGPGFNGDVMHFDRRVALRRQRARPLIEPHAPTPYVPSVTLDEPPPV